jgi:hypothetical protein
MTYKLTVEQKPAYLHVIVTGQNSKENVLIEERLDAKRFAGILRALAYVDVKAEGSLMEFAETVAVNRGLPVQVFSNVAEADRWLAFHAKWDLICRA